METQYTRKTLSDYLIDGIIPSISDYLNWPCQIQFEFIQRSKFIKRMYPLADEKYLIFMQVRVSSRMKHQLQNNQLDASQRVDEDLIRTLCLPPN